jgi:hypothetical protein
MAALTAKRLTQPVVLKTVTLPATQEQVYQGGLACWDTTTGTCRKGIPSVSLIPIGFYMADKLIGASDPTVEVQLLKEIWCKYFANDGTVLTSDVGDLCYILDDQTVSQTDNTNTRSVAGRIWAVNTSGVLVELHTSAGDRLGGLDA